MPRYITASQLIKRVLNSQEGTNPLEDDFDISLLTKEIQEELEFIKEMSMEVQNIEQIDVIVEFFKELNLIYEDILDYVLDALPIIENDDQNIFELIFRVTNYDFCNIMSGAIDEPEDEDVQDFLLNSKRKLKNLWGERMYSADAVDTTADVANLLLSIVKKYTRERPDFTYQLDIQEEGTLFKKVLIHTNLLFVLRENFSLFLNEFVELKITGTDIKFTYDPEYYLFLKTTGKKRYQGHIHEPVISLPGLLNEHSPRYNISYFGGELKLIKTKEKYENQMPAMVTSAILVYYIHLNTIKLPYLNITVYGIAKVIAQIQSLLMQLDLKQVLLQIEKSEDLKDSPVKIKKNQLISFLQDRTDLSRSSIERILYQITSIYTVTIDVWKTPLIAFGDYYYFLLTPLAGGHPVYFVQNILNKVLPIDNQISQFKKLVVFELESADHGYLFQRVSEEEVKQFTNKNICNLLVYNLSEFILFIEVFHMDFPIQSLEYGNATSIAAHSALSLSEIVDEVYSNTAEFIGKVKKQIIKLVVCNFPSISGMNIEGCFVMDLTLLKNYINVGEYNRGSVVMRGGQAQQNLISSYKYYNNEDEFNKNLKRFCFSPDPIAETNDKLKLEELPIAKGIFDFNITVEYAEDISNKDVAYQEIQKIEFLLRQLFYFKNALEKEENAYIKEHVESRLAFLLPEVFNRIAFEKSDRYLRVELIRVFESAGLLGISYLMFLNLRLFDISSKKKIKASEKFDITLDEESAKKDLQLLIKSIAEQKIFSLSGYELNFNLPEERIDNLVKFFIEDIASIPQRHYSLEELEDRWRIVVIFTLFVKGRQKFDVYLYKFLLNFVDLLNYNFLYQKARDVSEEILEYSFKNEKEPMIGWLCLLKCYIKQDNSYEALSYSNLVLSVLTTKEEVEEYLFIEAFFSLMLLYRGMGNVEQLKNIYEVLEKMELSEYDRQKIHLSYYYGLLKSDKDEIPAFLEEVKIYLNENIEKIISYGHYGCLPWFTFVLNILNLIKEKVIDPDAYWTAMLATLEVEVEPDTGAKVKAQFEIDDKVSAELYKEALSRLFDTRNHFDLTFDIKQLMLLANNITERAIAQSDFDLIFLSGLVLTDQMLTFQISQSKEKDHFLARGNEQYKDRINSYTNFIGKNLELKETQILVWLFSIHADVYMITIRPRPSFELQKIHGWDLEKMYAWVAKMKNFYFPDKAEFSINDQEQDYIKILKNLKEFALPISGAYGEILFYSSIRMGEFPFQLIAGSATDNIETHQWLVKEYCEKEKIDFISFNKPISNVISLEWLIEHGSDITIPVSQFTTELWAPIEDGDLVLNMTYESLLPILTGTYSTIIHTKNIPDKKIDSTINIFLAHGGKDFEGFRAIYTRESEGHAILNEKGVATVFGSGTIAVLFVCNSAFITKQLFSEKLVAFTQEILSLGYQAVVAPAWGLNPEIAMPWLTNFLENLKTGDTISFAVQKSNHAITKEGYREHIGFYSPTGWAGMHLYGNPNIRFYDTP